MVGCCFLQILNFNIKPEDAATCSRYRATRISIGLSITRAFPKRTRYYYASLALVFALVAATIAIEVLCVAKCAVTYATWSVTPPYQCYAGFPSYVAFACCECKDYLIPAFTKAGIL